METKRNEIEHRRRYTEEFKRDAVNRVMRTGKTCQEVGAELGINGTTVARWRRERILSMDANRGSAEEIKPSETARMLAEARREVEDLREQRDILKKALSIFSHRSNINGVS